MCSNGSLTIRLDPGLPEGYEVVEMVTFDPGPALRLLHRHLPDALFAVEEIGVGFRMNKPFPPGELHGEHTIVGVEELAAEHVTRLVVRSPEHTPAQFHALASEIGLADVTYAIGWTAWMDVAPAGVTKASALEPLRERLGRGATDPRGRRREQRRRDALLGRPRGRDGARVRATCAPRRTRSPGPSTRTVWPPCWPRCRRSAESRRASPQVAAMTALAFSGAPPWQTGVSWRPASMTWHEPPACPRRP